MFSQFPLHYIINTQLHYYVCTGVADPGHVQILYVRNVCWVKNGCCSCHCIDRHCIRVMAGFCVFKHIYSQVKYHRRMRNRTSAIDVIPLAVVVRGDAVKPVRFYVCKAQRWQASASSRVTANVAESRYPYRLRGSPDECRQLRRSGSVEIGILEANVRSHKEQCRCSST